jgi:signal transduction histidine kinase/CheY-like chemotaxis protein
MEVTAAATHPSDNDAPQRVVKVRRDYNGWVARETLEDYALRFTPRGFRRWSEWRVANTALGGAASFLVLEAVGATLLVQYGFVNALWAILATGLVIIAAGWPISVYAARHGLDMDLLTRGAGFGYIGSTITSLIYASFTFIFFALEAAVMAYALDLAFDIPPAWGYLICALVVIPLVTHGVTAISRLQAWTQPLWLAMLVLPFIYVFRENPGLLAGLARYAGESGRGADFDLLLFGAATTVGIALITQMGEQADYLRFMPERAGSSASRGARARWWAAVAIGGPGWVIPGVAKMLGGALLAYLAITLAVPSDRAVDPNQMYLAAYQYVFPGHYGWAVAATALFVVVSQLKINVTNAYAGSLAWSNFFARVTHSHPGRVVWMVFNIAVALMLMELDVFRAIGEVLGLYANIAIAWMMAVVADLVINKPLGLSPKGIEFKRAHLYDVNPVGVGAMGIASLLSVAAHLGAFGPLAQAFSALIALVTAFVASPLIAWATGGRYYIARRSTVIPIRAIARDAAADGVPLQHARTVLLRCCVCERDYEAEDIAQCPAYGGPICSLCCALDARCDDLCKPQAKLSAQWSALLAHVLPPRVRPYLDTGLAHYLLLMALVVPALALLFSLLYQQELRQLGPAIAAAAAPSLKLGFIKAFAAVALLACIAAWWLVLAHQTRVVAQEESKRQTRALQSEVASHRRTDLALQNAKRAADSANQAKSRYITAISHELRTPLNSILGYAQLLDEDDAMPPQRRQAVRVIRRGGDHLLSLIEGTMDIARIESGKLALDIKPMLLRESLAGIARLFELQAAAKGLRFETLIDVSVPAGVRADERRLRQILINVIGNAVKFTSAGHVRFRAGYAREMARFEIEDSGPGMSVDELQRIFEPFVRGSAAGSTAAGGSGLGLTIAKMLTDLMGGEMTVISTQGQGTRFTVRLFLPEVDAPASVQALPQRAPAGYQGVRRRVLVVDNEEADRLLLADVLSPLGFEVLAATSGEEAMQRLNDAPVDAILMDLAMPGLDGWATIRRLRELGLSSAPLAIVSANAFDRGLDNDAGIAPEDFLVKPVRVPELLAWLGRRLELQWIEAAPQPPDAAVPAAAPAVWQWPPAVQLVPLGEAAGLGWLRGVQAQLDAIEAADAGRGAHAAFVAWARERAAAFQFDAISAALARAGAHDGNAHNGVHRHAA